MNKPFKTFEEQVKILSGMNNNKFRMKVDEDTIFNLMRNNYYSITNFYKDPFLKKTSTKEKDIFLII